jgi:hypothetical protein
VLFRFLENYLSQLEGPLAVQVWHRFLQLAKDIISSVRDCRPQVFPVLRCVARCQSPCIVLILSFRCVSILADKITQTTALEDRRIRKDLQVFYLRALRRWGDFLRCRKHTGNFLTLQWYPSTGARTRIIGVDEIPKIPWRQMVGIPQCRRVSRWLFDDEFYVHSLAMPLDPRLDEKPISRPTSPPPGVDRADQVRIFPCQLHIVLIPLDRTHRPIYR